MVGIPGIGNLAAPANPKRVEGRERQAILGEAKIQDEVLISHEGQEASAVARLVEKAGEDEVRQERIARVRESLEQGTYKVQEVVLQLAGRITRYLAAT